MNTEDKMALIKNIINTDYTTYARVLWCDLSNIIRSKSCHIKQLENYLNDMSISKSLSDISKINHYSLVGSPNEHRGKVLLVPDINTLRRLPFANHHISAMASLMVHQKPWYLCARGCLERMIGLLKKHNIHLQVGLESEFYLLNESNQPINQKSFCSNDAMNDNYELIDKILNQLASQQVDVYCSHAEIGTGQFEISLAHTDPLKIADNMIIMRETIHAAAHLHNIKASFLPKIFLDKPGSGSHIHLSLWQNNTNCMADTKEVHGLSSLANSFMAGILKHTPAMMAFTTPINNSYKRLDPRFLCSVYNCWGIENRDCSLRLVQKGNSSIPSTIEVRTIDGAANPYLALSAIIAAGLDGIENNLTLPLEAPEKIATLSNEEAQKIDIYPLPKSVQESLQALELDTALQHTLSKDFCTVYSLIKCEESNQTKDMTHLEEITALLTSY